MCYFVTYSVSVWVCVSVLCICLSVRTGTAFVSPRTRHATRRPRLTTNKGRRRLRRGATRLTEDLLFPNHWCLLSSILSGTWTSEEGTQQQQLPLIFHRVGQTLLQVAQCTIFVMWCFIAKDIIWRNKTSPSHHVFFFFRKKVIHFIHLSLLQLISFFVRINIYKTYIDSSTFWFQLSFF